jgi:AmmeMemoRadiSam system protein B/AmmeMemoRadiSam system protein A
MQATRPAAVAGLFYPRARDALEAELRALLSATNEAQPGDWPKALIAPHAGYVYSGPIAAEAYAQLRGAGEVVKRVVLLGPCHRVPVRGLALPGVTALATPLGDVPVDQAALRAIADLPQVGTSPLAHAQEHSLEVQLPFLQTVLGDFAVVPLAVGDATADEVAEVLDRLWGGPETLIVVSSDLSHYHSYDEARAIDAHTCREILSLDARIDHEQACGATPIAGLLVAARRRGMQTELLDLRNSGDTAGDRDRVVGYAAFAFRAASSGDADQDKGRVLLQLARSGIRAALGGPAIDTPDVEFLREPGATFVTLMQQGELRGCIGTIEAYRALGQDVIANACLAALHDRRFHPLRIEELDSVDIEVSQLSAAKPISFTVEDDLYAALRPGIDGVTLCYDGRKATFLPQVWEQLHDPREFVAQLQRKAGLEGVPLNLCTVQRYSVDKWREVDFGTKA